ncbi:hypothetical protein BH11CYA1_BH11CYA1_30670 [soil metagenome]
MDNGSIILLGGVALILGMAQVCFYLGHTEEHKRTLRLQVLCGLQILALCSWVYCVSDWSNLGALYIFGCYCCLCITYNGVYNLLNRSGVSTDFGEFFLFGWFKTDNFCSEIFLGAFGCYFCFQGFISSGVNISSIYKPSPAEAIKPAAHHAHVPTKIASVLHKSSPTQAHVNTHVKVHTAAVHH